jgi:hypothetical protein
MLAMVHGLHELWYFYLFIYMYHLVQQQGRCDGMMV